MGIEETRGRRIGASPNEDEWQRIITNNVASDGMFYYAVRTTGIFCRPSCASKPPLKENTSIFRSADAAKHAGYRPCKRCKPTGEQLPDEEWVGAVTAYMEANYMEPLPLHKLAEAGHSSPYHLHRTFKRVTGLTPAAYVTRIRIQQAKELLISGDQTVAWIGNQVGLPNTPYFITLFKKETGWTPAQYRLMVAKGEDSHEQ
ncbi:bifunctional transcriptional activator/DNA repair enzyme AdaA [Paenibacillus sp. strain BS8-2]